MFAPRCSMCPIADVLTQENLCLQSATGLRHETLVNFIFFQSQGNYFSSSFLRLNEGPGECSFSRDTVPLILYRKEPSWSSRSRTTLWPSSSCATFIAAHCESGTRQESMSMVGITQMTIKIIGPRATHSNFQVLRYLHFHEDHILVMLHLIQHILLTYSTWAPCRLSVDHGQLRLRNALLGS